MIGPREEQEDIAGVEYIEDPRPETMTGTI